MDECQDLWEETDCWVFGKKGTNTWKFFIWEVLEYIYETRESHSLKSTMEVTLGMLRGDLYRKS